MSTKRDPNMTWFGAYLRRTMDERGWSTYDMERALQRAGLDINQSQVHRWCNGQAPRLPTAAAVLRVLGMSLVLQDQAGKPVEEVE